MRTAEVQQRVPIVSSATESDFTSIYRALQSEFVEASKRTGFLPWLTIKCHALGKDCSTSTTYQGRRHVPFIHLMPINVTTTGRRALPHTTDCALSCLLLPPLPLSLSRNISSRRFRSGPFSRAVQRGGRPLCSRPCDPTGQGHEKHIGEQGTSCRWR